MDARIAAKVFVDGFRGDVIAVDARQGRQIESKAA
jgi:hypothetical protein